MITYKKGDLLKSHCNIICHQVNCQGVMGSGIAKQIREKFPKCYDNYKDFLSSYGSYESLGSVCFSIMDTSTRFIANMFSQYDYLPRGKNHTNYEAFRSCIREIKAFVLGMASGMELPTWLYSIGFPYKIGCGLGGGNWEIIAKIIEEEFSSPKYSVEIWEL